MSGQSPEKRSEGKLAEPSEVPFPPEYKENLTRGADGRLQLSGRRMTPDERAAALQEADKLVRGTYAECLQRIAEFEEFGPFLVRKAQERLDVISLPKYGHEADHIAEAMQVRVDIEPWLPHATEFAPFLARVSASMDSALGGLMVKATEKIKDLPLQSVVTDTLDALAAFNAIRLAAESGDMDALDKEAVIAHGKLEKVEENLAGVEDLLGVMAESGFLAGVHVAATFHTITGYIENRSDCLTTYLEATDYSGESDNVKRVVRRAGTFQTVYGAITIAIGQYGPLLLPKALAGAPLIGTGFAIIDVARTINEKRKLVEERKRHLRELVDAHQGRGAVSEMTWLGHALEDDRGALEQLVSATLEMCSGLQAMAQYP